MNLNIQKGAAVNPRDDVMLHVSVRPQENSIVRNHFQNNAFGPEERHGGNPVQAHQSFEIAITAEQSVYRITINGVHFCTFTHRLPLSLAQYLSIDGICTIAYVTIDHLGASSFPPNYIPVPTPASVN